MKKIVVLLLAFTLLFVACSSDDDDKSVQPPTGVTLSAINLGIAVTWEHSSDSEDSDFAGYNIYVADHPLLDATDRLNFKDNTYPDTSNYYEITGLELGTTYYVHVRAELDDNTLSDFIEEYEFTVTLVPTAPTGLTFQINSGETAILTWESSADEANEFFAGYTIYKAITTFNGIEDDTEYELFTGIDSNSIEVEIDRDIEQYFVLRSVLNNDGTMYKSDYSNEIDLAGTIFGTDTIYMAGLGETYSAGIGFSTGEAVLFPLVAENRNNITLYFGSENEDDSPGQRAMKSPDLYNEIFLTTRVKSLGYGNWLNYTTTDISGMGYQVNVQSGETVSFKTSDNKYGKIYIHDINPVDGTDYFSAIIKYSYQPIVNYPCF